MAMFRGHVTFSAATGFVVGGLGVSQFGIDPGVALLAALVTTFGGILPDIDSQSGIPVREVFGLAAVFVPLILLRRISQATLDEESRLLFLLGGYLFIRFGLSKIFKHLTVHRGMFHSIPAMVAAGAMMFVAYRHPDEQVRLFLAGALMIGFFSHLVLDELYSVDFRGLKIQLNQFAGSALKMWSKSMVANVVCYAILGLTVSAAWNDYRNVRAAAQLSEPGRPPLVAPTKMPWNW